MKIEAEDNEGNYQREGLAPSPLEVQLTVFLTLIGRKPLQAPFVQYAHETHMPGPPHDVQHAVSCLLLHFFQGLPSQYSSSEPTLGTEAPEKPSRSGSEKPLSPPCASCLIR